MFGSRPVIHNANKRRRVRRSKDRRKFSRTAARVSSANLPHDVMRGGYRI